MAKSIAGSGVRSVQLALDVLETVVLSGGELGVTQIAERVKCTKGSVHRHLFTLVERGYLTQNQATTRYAVGAKSRLMLRHSPDADLVTIADARMRDLRDRLGHSVVLSSIIPRGALVLLTVAGNSAIEIGVRPGSELAFHASAQGKVMLAFAPDPVRRRILAATRPRFTAHTVTEAAALEEQLIQIAQRGYSTAPEETMIGINSIAAPIFDGTNACVASVALVGSIQFLTAKPPATLVKALQSCADDISRGLGHRLRTDTASGDERSRHAGATRLKAAR